MSHPKSYPVPRRGPAAERPRQHPMSGPQHLPLRPLWLCRACGHSWPCAEARLLLRVEYDDRWLDLAVYLSGLYFEATHDLFRLDPDGGPTPPELFARFVAWGPYRRSAVDPPRACTGRCRLPAASVEG
ncbi:MULTISPECIES: hypothetical protein [unclassified Micromonospora]|uniref:hypothetical protein n=1 Tax=unclassified Micromonospora TaxID=2617518 RepID=UPI0010348143|nr:MULTISPECIES: hypothetical protein [unclassified Micromonospora]QKW11344.1 hypothetical protein HUT12_00130 [Verrucosispora sp. NA02020]TBL38995.1 hypothetical protein EYA84_08820 [Verrucosispora sp. SN26_14.1]